MKYKKNIIYIVSAPSGTGKSSLLEALFEKKVIYNTKLLISYTSRCKRSNEINGKHYFFITKDKFMNLISKGFFLEYAKVLGNYYGTSLEAVNVEFSSGYNILANVDYQGARLIRNRITNTCSIFILPPSKDELHNRLIKRDQDTELVIRTRMSKLYKEISCFLDYDYLLINKDFSTTLKNLKSIIKSEQYRLKYQKENCNKIISNMLEKTLKLRYKING